jgi:hypothetical protein
MLPRRTGSRTADEDWEAPRPHGKPRNSSMSAPHERLDASSRRGKLDTAVAPRCFVHRRERASLAGLHASESLAPRCVKANMAGQGMGLDPTAVGRWRGVGPNLRRGTETDNATPDGGEGRPELGSHRRWREGRDHRRGIVAWSGQRSWPRHHRPNLERVR